MPEPGDIQHMAHDVDRERILVGAGELVVARSPTILAALGLGSCVGLLLYDPVTRVGGMAHVMLPANPHPSQIPDSTRFAEHALGLLLERMLLEGAGRERLEAKLVGGARMVTSSGSPGIGRRNVATLRSLLRQQRIPLLAADVGGRWGRSVEFDLHTGRVRVRSFQRDERAL